ncbi:MAG: HD domain-containing protein [Prevotella sp.]
MTKIEELALAMIDYNHGDPKRIQHTTKVHAYAALIGKCEGLDEETLFILESAALVHDIGIRASEQKFGHQNGKLQEQEGPAVARELLTCLGGYTGQQTERICWLVAHHHTYHVCEDLDYQILIEADFLVNLLEDNESANAIRAVRRNIFRTESGIRMIETMFGIDIS